MPRQTDLAWAAGIIDGEGSFVVGLNARGRGYPARYLRLTLTVSMSHLPTLRRIHRIFGLGKVGVCTPRKRPQKQMYYWTARAQRAAAAASSVLPYLTTKKSQARILLELAEEQKGKIGRKLTPGIRRFQEVRVARIRKLNH